VENPATTSVLSFKRLIAEKESVPPQQQRLIFVSEELVDEGRTIDDVIRSRKDKAGAVDGDFFTFHLIKTTISSSSTTSSPLATIEISPNRKRPAAQLASPPSRAKLAKKCAFPGCIKRSVVIIGDCKFCNEKFCSSHRLVEDHLCPATASCRQASFDKNANKLLSEKCVAQKLRQY